MAEKKPSLWKRITGYTAFALFALVVAFFLSFPYDALRDRVRLEADAAGYFVRIGSMGPGLLAIRAKDVQISKKSDADPPPEPLKLDSISVGPSLFPPGLKVKVKGFDGTITTVVSGFSSMRLKVDAEDIDVSKGNLKAFSGIDFSGVVDAHLDLTLPKGQAAGPAPAEPDLSLASGSFTLTTKGLSINGGSMNIPIPQFGPEPTPVDLPKIVLGDLGGKVKIEKGAATVEELKNVSPDLEVNVSGTLKLAKRLPYSEANMEVRLKPDPEFQKRLGMLGSAISFLGPDPKDPQWRLARLTGYIGRPQFR
ncbi:MAG: type II secretion system protein GspN [Myxococcota bacterium]